MEKNKMKKTVWGASVAVVLTTGAALGVSAYQSGIDFHPSEEKNTFRANQVRFDDTNDAKGRDNTAEQNESEFLERDSNAEDSNRPQEQNNADYQFEREQLRQNFSDAIALNTGTADVSAIGGSADSADTVYDFTDDRSQADVVLNGGAGDSGGGQGSAEPTQPIQPTEPTQPTQPSDSNNNSNNSSSGGTDATTPTPDQTPVTPEPIPGYGDASLDPDTDKTAPDFGFETENKEYMDGALTKDDIRWITISQPSRSDAALYRGQKNVSAQIIFNALETYIIDQNLGLHRWEQKHLDKYIRIDAVHIGNTTYRFDASNQTIDIPEDAEVIGIDISYRFTLKNSDGTETAWISNPDGTLTYRLEQTRLLVLSEALQDKGQKIDASTVLNRYSNLASDKTNPPIGTKVDLYYYQRGLLGEDRLETLFPGWRENGEPVPWEYPVTAGRHVLEPAARLSLDSSYVVSVKPRWIDVQSIKYTRQSAESGQELTFMQTLTDYTGEYAPVLAVPKYVQAVDFAANNHLKAVEYLRLSDTVRYVNTNQVNLRVDKGYQLSGENPVFAVTADGILTNAAGTEYIGIPYSTTKLTIPNNIERVTLPRNTQLRQLVLEAEDAANLPKIDYGGMKSGTIIVPDAVLLEFISANKAALAGTDIAVRSVGQIIKEDAVLSKDEETLQNVFSINRIYTVPKSVTKIAAYAFEAAPNTTRVVLPNNAVVLEENAFANSSVDTVLCRTEAQADKINQQLADWSLSEAIHAIALQTSKEGNTYYINGNEGVLLYGGSNTTEYRGLETAQNGEIVKITEIADGAFENNQSLQWAMLEQNVAKIGARAFYNCAALEGVFIQTEDSITIGDQAFDKCPSLYFVASNAKKGDVGDYVIDICNKSSGGINLTQLFVTNQCEKDSYSEQWLYFDGSIGHTLAVYDIGSTKMLYALNADGIPDIAIRSGKTLTGEITLPEETLELYSQAMFGTEGAYTLNWDTLPRLQYIDDYVFADTGLEGSVTTGAISFGKHAFCACNITDLTCTQEVSEIDELAFAECKKLTRINLENGFYYDSMLHTDAFYGCEQLKRVEINSSAVPKLTLFNKGIPFTFNSDWTNEEEAAYILFPEKYAQDESIVQDFVKKWRYAMLGYMVIGNSQPYDLLYEDIFLKELPFDIAMEDRYKMADAIIKERLLEIENRIRDILGAAHVAEPSEFYPHRIDRNDYITLVGAPSDIKKTFLGSKALDIPDGWCLDYLGKGAFSNTKNLESVIFDNGFAGIEQDAFQGVESETLQLTFYDATPPALLLDTEGKPFDFGIDIERLHINSFDADACIDFIRKWVYPLAGYENYEKMYSAMRQSMMESAENPAEITTEAVHEKMTEILLPIENQLRSVIWYISEDFSISTLPQVEKLSFTLGTDAGDTDAGDTDTDNTDADDTDAGDTDTGDIDTDDTDAGDTDTGDIDTGDTDTGDTDTDDTDAGDTDTGDTDAGDTDTGDTDTGDVGDTEDESQNGADGEAESTSQGAEEGGAE